MATIYYINFNLDFVRPTRPKQPFRPDQLLWNLANDEINGLVFIDFKKAFDLIDHKILLSKLKHFGVAAKELSLFENYLKDRYQIVHLNGKDSIYKTVEYGVPQGSILGPLLFLVTINIYQELLLNHWLIFTLTIQL